MYPQNRQPKVSIFVSSSVGFSSFSFSREKVLGLFIKKKKQPEKKIRKNKKLINHPTDHFDFDSTITLASFCEHITGSLAEIAKFCGTISLL